MSNQESTIIDTDNEYSTPRSTISQNFHRRENPENDTKSEGKKKEDENKKYLDEIKDEEQKRICSDLIEICDKLDKPENEFDDVFKVKTNNTYAVDSDEYPFMAVKNAILLFYIFYEKEVIIGNLIPIFYSEKYPNEVKNEVKRYILLSNLIKFYSGNSFRILTYINFKNDMENISLKLRKEKYKWIFISADCKPNILGFESINNIKGISDVFNNVFYLFTSIKHVRSDLLKTITFYKNGIDISEISVFEKLPDKKLTILNKDGEKITNKIENIENIKFGKQFDDVTQELFIKELSRFASSQKICCSCCRDELSCKRCNWFKCFKNSNFRDLYEKGGYHRYLFVIILAIIVQVSFWVYYGDWYGNPSFSTCDEYFDDLDDVSIPGLFQRIYKCTKEVIDNSNIPQISLICMILASIIIIREFKKQWWDPIHFINEENRKISDIKCLFIAEIQLKKRLIENNNCEKLYKYEVEISYNEYYCCCFGHNSEKSKYRCKKCACFCAYFLAIWGVPTSYSHPENFINCKEYFVLENSKPIKMYKYD